MAYQLICEVEPVGSTCSTGWQSVEVLQTDFSVLVDLLSFDLEIFGGLMGTCVVIFIMSYSAGHVARNMGRV